MNDPIKRIPEFGKHLARALLQAVVVGIGFEVGKDIYGWVKKRKEPCAEAKEKAQATDDPPVDKSC